LGVILLDFRNYQSSTRTNGQQVDINHMAQSHSSSPKQTWRSRRGLRTSSWSWSNAYVRRSWKTYGVT